ncbi:MAG: hypothetical protein JNM91_03535, partial [Flavobacteriales bacterium]|nr:hypothetical protein [Flavobacteriales bacterium]
MKHLLGTIRSWPDAKVERWILIVFLLVRIAFIGVSEKPGLDLDRDSVLYD